MKARKADMVWLARLCLLSGTCGAVAHAHPRGPAIAIETSYRNTTIPVRPSPTGSDCNATCTVEFPAVSALSWIRTDDIVYTSTMTVATLVYYVDKRHNQTQIQTEFEVLPGGYSEQSLTTNAQGTVYAELNLTTSNGFSYTKLVYPTAYYDYADEYRWDGVMPTLDATNGAGCRNNPPNTSQLVFLKEHPAYPQPVQGGPADPKGTEYTLLWVPVNEQPSPQFFKSAFPTHSAFANCASSLFPTATPAPITTTKFITETTTIYTEFSDIHHVSHVGVSISGVGTDTKARQTTIAAPVLYTDLGSDISSTPTPDIKGKVHVEQSVDGLLPSGGEGKADGGARTTSSTNQNQSKGTYPSPTETPGLPKPIFDFLHDPAVVSAIEAAAHKGEHSDPSPNAGNIVTTNAAAASTPAFPTLPIPTTALLASNPASIPTTTSRGAFVLPDGQTAAIGETVTLNGVPTVLSAPTASTVYTLIPMTTNGVEISVPAFIMPGGQTATLGQTVTLNGITTVLPAAVFTSIPTTINGFEPSVPAYILPDGKIASLGQTVTLNGMTTVLPSAVLAAIPTTMNGVETSVLAYVLPDGKTATLGQTVTLNSVATVLAAPSPVLISILTTIDGVQTSVPAYILPDGKTATIGQTVTVNGVATVLTSILTNVDGVSISVPVYILPNGKTATIGQTVTIGGSLTVLSTPSPMGITSSPKASSSLSNPKPKDAESSDNKNGPTASTLAGTIGSEAPAKGEAGRVGRWGYVVWSVFAVGIGLVGVGML